MEKCDFCLYRETCIGEIPGPDGKCMGFAVPPDLQESYQAFLEEEKKNDFAALCCPTDEEIARANVEYERLLQHKKEV